LVRQNLTLFVGGLVAGIGGFVYHAIAGRVLGPTTYGEVAFLIAVYSVGTAPALILVVVLARYTATLVARGDAGVRSLMTRTIRLIAIPGLVAVLMTTLVARPVAAFEHLGSALPVVILGISIALIWQVAIPRGILQGLQRFTSLALNLGLEIMVRTTVVFGLLIAGYAVSGAMAAVFAGLAFSFALGLFSLRDHFSHGATRVQLRVMAGFSLTAAAGIIGIQILYNQDVILAEHFLSGHDGGIYGGLNKIGTILFFLTLSVSQVLFPRVVEAVAKEQHPPLVGRHSHRAGGWGVAGFRGAAGARGRDIVRPDIQRRRAIRARGRCHRIGAFARQPARPVLHGGARPHLRADPRRCSGCGGDAHRPFPRRGRADRGGRARCAAGAAGAPEHPLLRAAANPPRRQRGRT
jgi:O-antigen/teichoic acid export membrane protein